MNKQKPNVKFVKPAKKGLKVPNPDSGAHLLEEGENVVWSSYWQRRVEGEEIKVSDEAPQLEVDKTKHGEASKVNEEKKHKHGGN